MQRVITDRYKETFETWNKIASLYQEKFMDLDLYNESYDFICSTIVKQKAKLLEVGCGPGNITNYLLSKRPDFDIYGIDIAPNMVELSKMNNPGASFGIMDSRNIGEIKSRYDGIICGFCLPYLSHTDGAKFIAAVYNLLNENGLFYLSFVEGDPNKSEYQTNSSGSRTFFYFYSLRDLEEQLIRSGFELRTIFKVEFRKSDNTVEMHTIITASKKTAKKN
jgi:2-polyprenyl-3-methyl-5-hydroxy-6-metoxy-1,4-benzoquinol methylase